MGILTRMSSRSGICAHCLNDTRLQRVPIAESPSRWWHPEFDPNRGPTVSVLDLCADCARVLLGEISNFDPSRDGLMACKPRELILLDTSLDAEEVG